MVNLATLLFGPLAGPECRRAVARGWLILVRSLAATALFGVAVIVLWTWWIAQQYDPTHRPYYEVRFGLAAVEFMLVTIAMVLGPALMAGSLAGERERGVLALLLTTRVSAREVVTGRLAGKFSQVGMILLGGAPALVLLTALAGIHPATLFVLLLLPTAVALGCGGLAAVASTLSRRGRDALLAVYMMELIGMLSPLAGNLASSGSAYEGIAAFNPFSGIKDLAFNESTGTVWLSSALWVITGALGTTLACWKLRPSCLSPNEGERTPRFRSRRGLVPPVDEKRPMVWKELFIERVGTLGRFGRWVGLILVLILIGGSLGLMGAITWHEFRPGDPDVSAWARDQMGTWVGLTGGFLACLIQWAIGLRAAVSISAERERGTWDALLTSPLDAREIVLGKLWGNLYALRWLIFASLLAWITGGITDSFPLNLGVRWSLDVMFIGAFMAAVGVRTSLSCQTATRAMALTIGFWLGAYVVVLITTWILLCVGILASNAVWMLAAELGLVAPLASIWFPVPWYIAWPFATDSLYLLATLLIVSDTRLRFDRIAGRMTQGQIAIAFDEFLYGRPMAPIPIDQELASADAIAGPR